MLWRPGRPDRGDRQRQHGRPANQPNNRQPGSHQRHGAPAGDATAGEQQQGQRGRPNDRSNNRSEGQRFDKRGGERNGKRNEGGNGFKGGKPGDNRRDNNKPFNAPTRQSEKPMDPDSPFAKLMALKAQMEKGNG